jgi:hypothetical protein
MSKLSSLIDATGRWKGIYRLWEPSASPQESRTAAVIAPIIGDRFVRIDYTWSYHREPQQGLLLVGCEDKARVVTAVWIDSWHMGPKFMICRGVVKANGAIAVRGSYAVPGGADWGWRTVIEPRDDGSLRMRMYNISPDGREDLAVDARLAKAAGTRPNKRSQPTKVRREPARKRRIAARLRG